MNVWDNITPSLGPFGPVLSNPLGILLAAAWAVAFYFCAFYLIRGVVQMARARKANVPDVYDEAKDGLMWPMAGTIMLTLLPILWSVLVNLS